MLNAFSVDVEDYFQVNAFERAIPRDSWGSLRAAGGAQHPAPARPLRRARSARHLLHPRLGGRALAGPGARDPRRRPRAGHPRPGPPPGHGDDPAQFREDVRRSKRTIEDVAGVEVIGYRAPSYSIVRETMWAVDILAEEGFRYDSSIFPIHHDHYGIPDFPRFPRPMRGGNGALCRSFRSPRSASAGTNLPFIGGGYLRHFPMAFIRWGMRWLNERERRPAVVYIHPWEIDPGQPVQPVGALTRLRHYRNLDLTEGRLARLFSEYTFTTCREILALMREISSAEPLVSDRDRARLAGPCRRRRRVAVETLRDHREAEWDRYVRSAPGATFFHQLGWRWLVERTFGHRAHYLTALRDGRIAGVLPLFELKSLLFGHSLVSIPFAIGGGLVADDDAAAQALLAHAKELARELQVDYLELRSETPLDDPELVDQGPLRHLPRRPRRRGRRRCSSGWTRKRRQMMSYVAKAPLRAPRRRHRGAAALLRDVLREHAPPRHAGLSEAVPARDPRPPSGEHQPLFRLSRGAAGRGRAQPPLPRRRDALLRRSGPHASGRAASTTTSISRSCAGGGRTASAPSTSAAASARPAPTSSRPAGAWTRCRSATSTTSSRPASCRTSARRTRGISGRSALWQKLPLPRHPPARAVDRQAGALRIRHGRQHRHSAVQRGGERRGALPGGPRRGRTLGEELGAAAGRRRQPRRHGREAAGDLRPRPPRAGDPLLAATTARPRLSRPASITPAARS